MEGWGKVKISQSLYEACFVSVDLVVQKPLFTLRKPGYLKINTTSASSRVEKTWQQWRQVSGSSYAFPGIH